MKIIRKDIILVEKIKIDYNSKTGQGYAEKRIYIPKNINIKNGMYDIILIPKSIFLNNEGKDCEEQKT